MAIDLASAPPVAIVSPAPNGGWAIGDKMFYISMFPVKIDNLSMLESRLNSFERLTPNWDGYDADSIDPRVIANSKKFLAALPEYVIDQIALDNITPTSYGTIVIDWGNEKGELISTELGIKSFGFFSEFIDSNPLIIERVDFNENSLPEELFSAFTKLYKD
jgi:hypothetical protein